MSGARLPVHGASAWSAAVIAAYLEEARIPVRLAANDAAGFPMICSLWFLFEGGRLWCAVQRDAKIARRLAADPRCAFEVAGEAPPYRGVRGRGRAAIVPERGEAVLARLLDRYLGGRESDLARWLLGRAETEVALRVEPTWITSWDYSARMKDR